MIIYATYVERLLLLTCCGKHEWMKVKYLIIIIIKIYKRDYHWCLKEEGQGYWYSKFNQSNFAKKGADKTLILFCWCLGIMLLMTFCQNDLHKMFMLMSFW